MNVIALGFFDGVHIGHAELLKHAAGISGNPCALTFDIQPEMLTKGVRRPLIVTDADREVLLRQYVHEVLTLHFDDSLMHISWNDFIDKILVGRFNAGYVVAGHDFRFGYRGEGTPERLSAACERLGLGCDIIPKVELDGVRVSSTRIRELITLGDMENAGRFLGRAYFLSGEVEHGRKLGSSIGAPTVNLRLPEEIQTPAMGVYLTRTIVNGEPMPSVTNVGVRPTVEQNGRPTAETTIFGFAGDLYGEHIRVEFLKFMRPEQKFGSVDALREQIEKDMALALNLHNNG